MAAEDRTIMWMDTRSRPTRQRSGRDPKDRRFLGGRGIRHDEYVELVVPVITQTEGDEIHVSTGVWGGGTTHGPLRQIDVDALTAGGFTGLLRSEEDIKVGIRDRFRSGGKWYTFMQGGDSSQTPVFDTMYATPFVVGNVEGITFDRVGIEIITGGGAGAVVRLGFFYDDEVKGNYPGRLMLDAGTVDGVATGRKDISINQTFPPGLYWAVLACQGNASVPTIKQTSGYSPGFGGLESDLDNLFRGGYKEDTAATSGSFPSTFPTPENASRGSKIYVRTV